MEEGSGAISLVVGVDRFSLVHVWNYFFFGGEGENEEVNTVNQQSKKKKSCSLLIVMGTRTIVCGAAAVDRVVVVTGALGPAILDA